MDMCGICICVDMCDHRYVYVCVCVNMCVCVGSQLLADAACIDGMTT